MSAAFAWLLKRYRWVSVSTRYSLFFLKIEVLVCTSPWQTTTLEFPNESANSIGSWSTSLAGDTGSQVSSQSRDDLLKEPLSEPSHEPDRPLLRLEGDTLGQGLEGEAGSSSDSSDALLTHDGVRLFFCKVFCKPDTSLSL